MQKIYSLQLNINFRKTQEWTIHKHWQYWAYNTQDKDKQQISNTEANTKSGATPGVCEGLAVPVFYKTHKLTYL